MSTATAVSPREAKGMWENGKPVVFLDARNPQAWASSTEKLPGAIRVPADELESHLDEIPHNATLIAYCT
jgi:rhodanese-related sulfurtransferase